MRIVISGTYGAGKSTLAYHLAQRTGIPLVGARGMRAFLQDHLAGKRLEDCSFEELIELGVRRFRERLLAEAAHPTGFISDGSTLNEWAYGLGRVKYGFSLDSAHSPGDEPSQASFELVMARIGKIFREHAQTAYDRMLHLPPEIPIAPDQHRPLMPEYRSYTDACLRSAYVELPIPVLECAGTIVQRTDRALDWLDIDSLRTPSLEKDSAPNAT